MTHPEGVYVEDMHIGQTASYTKTITDQDIRLFAVISGDDNPVHLDDAYAALTMFKGRIAHGMLGASLISTVLGTKLPGPGCIYLDQTLSFKSPVRIGDEVEASVTVKELQGRRVRLACACRVGDKVVIEGEALVMGHHRDGEAT